MAIAYGFPSSEEFHNLDLMNILVIAFLYEIKFYHVKIVNNENIILEDLNIEISCNKV